MHIKKPASSKNPVLILRLSLKLKKRLKPKNLQLVLHGSVS